MEPLIRKNRLTSDTSRALKDEGHLYVCAALTPGPSPILGEGSTELYNPSRVLGEGCRNAAG